jgi:hypothetical protein
MDDIYWISETLTNFGTDQDSATQINEPVKPLISDYFDLTMKNPEGQVHRL